MRQARAESDPYLREKMIEAADHYLHLDLSAARQRRRMSKPGYGGKRIIGFCVIMTLLALLVILILTRFFPATYVFGAVAFALGIILMAAAFSLRWTGAVSEGGMLHMVKGALGIASTNSAPSDDSEEQKSLTEGAKDDSATTSSPTSAEL